MTCGRTTIEVSTPRLPVPVVGQKHLAKKCRRICTRTSINNRDLPVFRGRSVSVRSDQDEQQTPIIVRLPNSTDNLLSNTNTTDECTPGHRRIAPVRFRSRRFRPKKRTYCFVTETNTLREPFTFTSVFVFCVEQQ